MKVEICENCFDYSKITDHDTCCNNSDYKKVKLITSAGTIQVKEQCHNCGNVKPGALGGLTKEQKESLPILNEPLRELRFATMREQYRLANSKINEVRNKQHAQQRESRRDEWMRLYTKYLQSPEWKNKRDLVLKRDNYICQCCLNNYATQVHHKSYEFVDLFGSEPCFDLVSVCGPCHDSIERMKKENRKSNNP
jgi:5-methylcytosine-specific restriction endonuclease McrA